MFHYLHCIFFCLAACISCWGLVFLWPADSNAEQCSSYLWVIYLSAIFFISLNNMKAYRLSAFLRSSGSDRRPKQFTHTKALKYAMVNVLMTAILLIVCHAVDPPTLFRVIADPNRPRLDYHECRTGSVTPALLYVIVIGHFVFSIYCISAVRNGMEAFQDGVVIKEAFVIFYACLVIALVLENLGLDIYT